MSQFEENLNRYAELLVVRGLNVQPGEFVQIWYETEAEEVALLAGEHAYKKGARHVHLAYNSPRMKYAQLVHGPQDERFYFPAYERVRNDQIVDAGGCFLNLRTNSEPYLFDSIPELSAKFDSAQWEMRDRYRKEGINKGKVAWSLTYPPSRKAAHKAYPELSEDVAYEEFWKAIFRMTHADSPDCLQYWESLDRTLHKRRGLLDTLQLKELRFTGPSTNLTVGLSPLSTWLGGSKHTAAGKSFTANVPSFEVFTTPDWRTVTGEVKITYPANVHGISVEGLRLTFREGKLVEFDCATNRDAYIKYIDQDAGARQLGEVALVGLDSPVAQEGRSFHETLYDENAACHIATGSAYAAGIKGGWSMSQEELNALGRNESVTHQDVMISNEHVSVEGITADGKTVELLVNGAWASKFA